MNNYRISPCEFHATREIVASGEYAMIKTSENIPASYELCAYGDSVSNGDSHMKINPVGTWVSCEWSSFGGQYMSDVTTFCMVVRVWTCNGITYWTREDWYHDNGYRCHLVLLSKSEFLTLINS